MPVEDMYICLCLVTIVSAVKRNSLSLNTVVAWLVRQITTVVKN